MNYATFAALTSYDTIAAALAAKPANGDAWLLNETKVARDGTMPDSGPAAQLASNQVLKASTKSVPLQRNKGNQTGVKTTAIAGGILGTSANYTYATSTGGAKLSTKGGGTFVNRETITNTKAPAIRHKVSWYVTDDTQAAGYRRVFGLLEDAATTSPYRDDDAQVRK
jgi:hypothetical protein